MQIASTPLDSKLQPVKARKPVRLQFGSSSLSPVTGFLSMLERQPLAELVFKDIAAFNVPKIALSRTWKERWDTATLELSNTAITLFSSLFLPGLLRIPAKWVSNVDSKLLGKEIPYAKLAKTEASTKLARMGVSFGFFFPFAAAFWAAPFFRNWLTLKRTQSANFESMIGFDGVKSKHPQRTLDEEMSYQKKTAWKVFATGVGLGLVSLFGFSFAARGIGAAKKGQLARKLASFIKEKGAKPLNLLFNNFDLKGKAANQIEGWPAQLIFWGLPAYLGWIHGARSDHERRERFLQSANALFWFFAAPKLSNRMWGSRFSKFAKVEYWESKFIDAIKANKQAGETIENALKNKVKNLTYDEIKYFTKATSKLNQQELTRLKNKKFAISGLAIPISALALVQFINFRVTEKKLKGKMAQTNATPPVTYPPHVLNAPYNTYRGNASYAYPNAPNPFGMWAYPPSLSRQRPPAGYMYQSR